MFIQYPIIIFIYVISCSFSEVYVAQGKYFIVMRDPTGLLTDRSSLSS